MSTNEPSVPAHVPPELVQPIPFQDAPGIERDASGAMDVFRDDRPIVYAPASRRGMGSWVLKSYELIHEAFHTPELFSSDRYSGFSALLGEDWPMPPMEYDPPHHQPFRVLLQPLFTPKRMATLEDGVSETVRELLARLRPQGRCEFQSTFGVPLPTTVFLRLVGLPLEDAPTLLVWERQLMHGETLDERIAGARSIKEYLLGHIGERERNPQDDMISYIVNAEVEGRRLTPDEKLGICFLLYGAGLDTVAAALGLSFGFLARNPERQQDLRNDPDQRPRAIEEMLRATMNIVPGRRLTQDTVFHGVEMKKGDFVALPTMFANRDSAEFPDATKIDFARENAAQHLSFGTGAHNCLGKHLARRELRIALDAWLDEMPPFRLGPGELVTYGGTVFGVTSLDLEWTAPTAA